MRKIKVLRPFRFAARDEVHAAAYAEGVREVKDDVAEFALANRHAEPFTEDRPAASAPASPPAAPKSSRGGGKARRSS